MLQKELEDAYDYSLYYVTALLEYFDLMLLDFSFTQDPFTKRVS